MLSSFLDAPVGLLLLHVLGDEEYLDWVSGRVVWRLLAVSVLWVRGVGVRSEDEE